MDKSFNDDELADIMNEIENLEKEFAESVDAAPAEEPQAQAEPEEEHVEAIDHTEPEVLAELVAKPIEEVVHKTNQSEKVVPMKKVEAPVHHAPVAAGHSSLAFKVEGQMTLSLAFEVNGQSVSLEISDEGLQIAMDSGASFHLPMSKAGAAKKAA
ncbi:MAG: hypothetical protein LW878_13840 [Proteobacteria bacterium]|jgi:hypothetical protein|nr:hypothetical protein [Pseudomonadota bacterium]